MRRKRASSSARRRPRQHRRAEGDRPRRSCSSFLRTANDTSLKLARAAVYITLRSRRYGMSLSPMIVTALVCASFSSRITWRPASRSSSAFSGAIRSPSRRHHLGHRRDAAAVDQDVGAADDDDDGLLRRLLGDRLRQLDRLRARQQLDAGGARQQEEDQDREDVDQRHQVHVEPWSGCAPLRSARFCSGVSFMGPLMSAVALDDGRVADRDVREQLARVTASGPAPRCATRAPRPSPAPACRTGVSGSASTVASVLSGNLALICCISADSALTS